MKIPNWLRLTLDNSPDPWRIKDNSDVTRYTYANPAFYEACNLPKHFDLMGRDDSEVPFDAAEYAKEFTAHNHLVEEKRVRISSFETHTLGREQVLQSYLSNNMPFFDEQGNCIGTIQQFKKARILSPRSFLSKDFSGHALFYPPTDLFSEKEWQVIYLLFCHFSYREMAEILQLSDRTVQNRVFSCLHKTDTLNYRDLLEYCRHQGWHRYIPPLFIQRGHILLT